MDEMREIVTMEQANGIFLTLAITGPVLGLLIGLIVGRKHGETQLGAFKGLMVGMLGPVNLLLWKVYNVLTDRMGLDTVKNLLVQLALFAGLGIVAGLLLGYYWRRQCGPSGAGPTDGLSPVAVGPSGPTPSRGHGAERRAEDSQEAPRES
jgi:hypothetical protein